MVNKIRIKILEERDLILDSLIQKTKQSFNRKSEKYSIFLPLIITETLEFMSSSPPSLPCNKNLTYRICCLKDDEPIVLKAIEGKKDIVLGPSLDESSLGGIIVRYGDGDLMICDNTIERRFNLATKGLLPEIRNILFK